MKLWFDYHVCDLRQLMSVYCKTKLELPELFMVIFFLFSPQRMNYFGSLRDILLKRPRVEFFYSSLFNFLSSESEHEAGEPYVASTGLRGRRRH